MTAILSDAQEALLMTDSDVANEDQRSLYDWVMLNLEDILELQEWHPRLALLAVASEVEIVICEVDPRTRTTRHTSEGFQRFIREHYTSSDSPLPRPSKEFLRNIFSQGNKCRHSRPYVLASNVQWAVTNAVALIDDLRAAAVDVICSECSQQQHLRFRDVFDATAETPWRCPGCQAIQVWPNGKPPFGQTRL